MGHAENSRPGKTESTQLGVDVSSSLACDLALSRQLCFEHVHYFLFSMWNCVNSCSQDSIIRPYKLISHWIIAPPGKFPVVGLCTVSGYCWKVPLTTIVVICTVGKAQLSTVTFCYLLLYWFGTFHNLHIHSANKHMQSLAYRHIQTRTFLSNRKDQYTVQMYLNCRKMYWSIVIKLEFLIVNRKILISSNRAEVSSYLWKMYWSLVMKWGFWVFTEKMYWSLAMKWRFPWL